MKRWPTLPVHPSTAQFFFDGAILKIRYFNSREWEVRDNKIARGGQNYKTVNEMTQS